MKKKTKEEKRTRLPLCPMCRKKPDVFLEDDPYSPCFIVCDTSYSHEIVVRSREFKSADAARKDAERLWRKLCGEGK